MEIAVATNTAPGAWWDQEDAVLATVLEVLEDQRRAVERARRDAQARVTNHV